MNHAVYKTNFRERHGRGIVWRRRRCGLWWCGKSWRVTAKTGRHQCCFLSSELMDGQVDG